MLDQLRLSQSPKEGSGNQIYVNVPFVQFAHSESFLKVKTRLPEGYINTL